MKTDDDDHGDDCTCELSQLTKRDLLAVAMERLFGSRLRAQSKFALSQYLDAEDLEFGGRLTINTPPKSGTVDFGYSTQL